jgi:hypothetical protein
MVDILILQTVWEFFLSFQLRAFLQSNTLFYSN